MDEETKIKIEKTYELSIENNRILRKIRRARIVGIIFKILIFIIVTGIGAWVYIYILQPYMDQVSDTYNKIQDSVGGISGEVDSNLKKLMEMLRLNSE